MSNILTIPASGSIYFDSGTAGSSTVPDLTGSTVSLSYNGDAGLNITSYNALSADRFSVDGSNGRLFSISDSLTGTIFSVNDAAGLPIIEVESDTVDTVTIGTYSTNALVVKDDKVGIGTNTPNEKLTVSGNISASGNIEAATADIPIITNDVIMNGTENTMPNQTLDGGDASVLIKSIADELYGWTFLPLARRNNLSYGSGSSNVGDYAGSMDTGTSAGANFANVNMTDSFNRSPFAWIGGNINDFPFLSRRFRFKMIIDAVTFYGDSYFWFGVWDASSYPSPPVLNDRGFGVKITPTQIIAQVHDGTTLSEASPYTYTENIFVGNEFELDYYQGSLTVKINGVPVNSLNATGYNSDATAQLHLLAYATDGTTDRVRMEFKRAQYKMIEM